jgi:phosphatidate phosphatase APP1
LKNRHIYERVIRRFPKIIIQIGARYLLGFKAEQKAQRNAMQLKRQRGRCANRAAKLGIFFAGNRLSPETERLIQVQFNA